MKKHILVLVVMLILIKLPLFAEIGENFAKGGIGLSGSLSFFNNFHYFPETTDQRKTWSLDLSPLFTST